MCSLAILDSNGQGICNTIIRLESGVDENQEQHKALCRVLVDEIYAIASRNVSPFVTYCSSIVAILDDVAAIHPYIHGPSILVV